MEKSRFITACCFLRDFFLFIIKFFIVFREHFMLQKPGSLKLGRPWDETFNNICSFSQWKWTDNDDLNSSLIKIYISSFTPKRKVHTTVSMLTSLGTIQCCSNLIATVKNHKKLSPFGFCFVCSVFKLNYWWRTRSSLGERRKKVKFKRKIKLFSREAQSLCH